MENMAPGYRFYPTEEELVSFYLRKKLEGDQREDIDRVIPVVDIYDYQPWDLPLVSGAASLRDTEQWFFFIPRQESEARGGRPKRLTDTGYWKATGSPNHVYSSDNCIIGMKRTMVFYNGRAPNGKKTDWKMNEYKAIQGEVCSSSGGAIPKLRQEFSLCRVYKKTKCLRAFDRRPPPPPAGLDRPRQIQKAALQGEDQGSTSSSANNSQKAEIRASSSESSSSEGQDGRQPSQSGEYGSTSMDVDIQNGTNWLSWEQVESFLRSDDERQDEDK